LHAEGPDGLDLAVGHKDIATVRMHSDITVRE
jgi:hypothetical protein